MSQKNLTVVARVKAKKGAEKEVRRVLSSLIKPTHQEPGCIDYVMHQGADDKSLFLFYENWKSKAALDEHLAKPYIQAFIAKTDDLLDGPIDITFWEKAEG